MRSLLFVVGLLILVSGCTSNSAITKRQYRQGFYNSLKTHSVQQLRAPIFNSDTLSGEKVNIIKINGDTIAAKIVHLDEKEIEYRKISNLNGPIYTVTLSSVNQILDPKTGKDVREKNVLLVEPVVPRTEKQQDSLVESEEKPPAIKPNQLVSIERENGDIVNAILISIEGDEVNYRKKSNPNGPIYTIDKSSVEQIKDSSTGAILLGSTKSSIDEGTHLLITLRGDTIMAIIESVNDKKVKYKKAANPDGPTYIKETRNILKITNENGNEAYSEIFVKKEENSPIVQDDNYYNEEANPQEETSTERPLETSREGVVGFIFGMVALGMFTAGLLSVLGGLYVGNTMSSWDALGYVLLAILSTIIAWIQSIIAGTNALINGILSVERINETDSPYKKDWRANFGVIAGAVVLVGIIAALVGLIMLASF
jgi:hypothetical protein